MVEELAQALNPLRVPAIRAFVGQSEEPWRDYAPLRHVRAHHLDTLPAGMTILNLRGSSVGDAEGLRRYAYLRWLNLSGTQVADLAPLAGLAGLRMLHLDQALAEANGAAVAALEARGVQVIRRSPRSPA